MVQNAPSNQVQQLLGDVGRVRSGIVLRQILCTNVPPWKISENFGALMNPQGARYSIKITLLTPLCLADIVVLNFSKEDQRV